jgi:hypothetical protein
MSASRSLVALVASVLTMGLPAQSAAKAKPAPDARKAAAPRPRILKLEEMKIEGKIQKPQAMFLMPRANLNVGELDHAEPLLPKITAAAEKEPF